MLLQVPSRRDAYEGAKAVVDMLGVRGKAGMEDALRLLPLVFLALPDDRVFATIEGRAITGAFLKAQGSAAIADGKLDVGDLMRAIMAFLALPVRVVERPLPPPPPPMGDPDAPIVLPSNVGGLRPDGLPDKGQEAWLEQVDRAWDEDGGPMDEDGIALLVSGAGVLTGPANIRVMTGELDQPSWIPSLKHGRPAPFAVTHHWQFGGGETYSLSSDTDEGHKPSIPLFATPAGGKGIQMGPRWRETYGWSVHVSLARGINRTNDPLPLLYWTTRPDGTRSNVVRILIAHA